MSIRAELKNEYVMLHPAQSASVIEALPFEDQIDEISGLKTESLVNLLDYLSPRQAGDIFASMDAERKAEVLNLTSPRLAVVLLAPLDEETRAS
ncbi:MAG: hypothetical protein WBN41_07670, partial [Lysobacterales bacterium]